MKKLAQAIVRLRKWILIAAILLLIPSAVGAVATRINYDILSYLPPELDSRIGQLILEEDYQLASTSMITVEGLPTHELLAMKADIDQIPGVLQTFWLSDVVDPAIPKEMLPADVQKFLFGKNDSTILIVRLGGSSVSEETMEAVIQIKKVLRRDCFFGGISVIFEDTKALVTQEMPLYLLLGGGACLLVLFLALEGTITPLLFMAGLLFPLVYNFGTNFFLKDVCFITEAFAAVRHLGLNMDFSIFLLHRYKEEKENAASNEEAMVGAICKTTTSIAASSLTTIAGFLALCAMRLTLGRDIGVVMAKGVALGVVCTVTVLPALLMQFRRPIERFSHRTLIPKLPRTARFVTRFYAPLLVVFLLVVTPFALAQSKVDVYYTLFDSLPQTMDGIVGTNRLKEDFNMTTTHFVIVDENLTNRQLTELSNKMAAVDGVNQVLSYEKFLGGAIPESMVSADLRDIFHAGGHRMILVNSSYKSGAEEQNAQLEKLNDIVKSYDPNSVISGEGAMTKDLIQVADVDFRNVNITSILAVFVIILISFCSLSIPVLLVGSIESAIFINMGIPYFTGIQLPFVASIVVGTIQLGATVDYAILTTTRFKEELQNGHTVKEAAHISVEQCSQSILTSGLTFFAATASVAAISQMELISSLCELISRGALISMLVIILILPALLIVFAPVIARTTRRWPKVQKAASTGKEV